MFLPSQRIAPSQPVVPSFKPRLTNRFRRIAILVFRSAAYGTVAETQDCCWAWLLAKCAAITVI